MSKVHPAEFKKLNNKEKKLSQKEVKMNEVKTNNNLTFEQLMENFQKQANSDRGLLAPPETEEERRVRLLSALQAKMLQQWQVANLMVTENITDKLIEKLFKDVDLDKDIKQTLHTEIFAQIFQPILESYGLMRASNEALYQEFKSLGIEVERPKIHTLDTILREIQQRIQIATRKQQERIT